MGRLNTLYLDENILPIPYRNVYAISFNGSSTINIYSNHSSDQNIVVFIIPDTNCNQHSFYAMSKNIFRIEITSKRFNHNLRTCGFSPSFITNVDRKVSFGYKSQINSRAQIFYGFNSNSQTVSLKKLNNSSTEAIDFQNFFNADSKSETILTNIQSPGFLVSDSVNSEIKTLSDVNTTYYVLYELNQTGVKAKMSFEREFDSKKGDKDVDNSMLSSHFDFLLYYDKHKRAFIYDEDWASSLDISYSRSMWEVMKWAWISVISMFVIVILLVVFCVFRRLNLCSYCSCCSCCMRSSPDVNSASERDQIHSHHMFSSENLNEDYEQMEYHYLGNRNNDFQSIHYAPDLDEEAGVVYSKSGDVHGDSESSNLQSEFDRKSYELDAMKRNRKKSASVSPYQNDEISLYSESDENDDKREEIPNPYGLPPANLDDRKNNENGDLC